MSEQYKRYRDEINKSGGSRRTPDEMRIAGINALLASVTYLSAPLQDFVVPAPMKFDDEELKSWANEHAIQSLIESGQLEQRPREIPPLATRESVQPDVLVELERRGSAAPPHPAVQFGIRQERYPTHDELLQWALLERRKSTSVFTQVLRRKAFLRSITNLCDAVENSLPNLIGLWDNESQAFRQRLDLLCSEEVDRRNSERERLVADNAPVQALVDKETKKIRDQQNAALAIVDSVHALFLSGDATITTLVLQALMSDNEGSAAPIGFDNGDLLVAMTAPRAEDVIWPEKCTHDNRISAAKKSKKEFNTDFYMFLLSHAVATAREAIVASPHIRRVRVLILDQKDEEKDFLSRRLVAALDVSRSVLEEIPNEALSQDWARKGMKVVDLWHQALQNGDSNKVLSAADTFETSSIRDIRDFLMKIVAFLEPCAKNFASYIDTPATKRPKLIEFTESEVNTADEIQVVVSEDVDSMKTIDVEVSMVSLPDFWVLCGLLGDCWNEEEVELDNLKRSASDLCTFLYPPTSRSNSMMGSSR